jgi:hypothetical protein
LYSLPLVQTEYCKSRDHQENQLPKVNDDDDDDDDDELDMLHFSLF